MNQQDRRKKHILMLTNHGVHEWRIVPGLVDTGGQNLFVNQFTEALANNGFRVTIINRGGYPHPVTGRLQKGMVKLDEDRRIVYIEDGFPEFVRKEDMHERIEKLAVSLYGLIVGENDKPDLIISHYWDAAAIAVKTLELLDEDIRHIWVPHSLGAIKSRKTTEDEDEYLRMAERINAERSILDKVEISVATSDTVRRSLLDDYGFSGRIFFIPPCIDEKRYRPFRVDPGHRIFSLLNISLSGGSGKIPKECRIITEVSRTDVTKRKDVLIKAFAGIMDKYPEVILVITIDRKSEVGKDLVNLIRDTGADDRVCILGSVWELLPELYNITDIYCSPSVMEGFGMSVQEAAACRTAIIASDLIPFAVEYLAPESAADNETGALIVEADDIEGFSGALEKLLSDDGLRAGKSENAYRLTIPYFTWPRAVRQFLEDLSPGYSGEDMR